MSRKEMCPRQKADESISLDLGVLMADQIIME